jgi:hypothetical protein
MIEPTTASRWPTKECDGPHCTAQIIWALTAKGKKMPVDAEPTHQGNLELTAPGGLTPLAKVVRRNKINWGKKMYVPHWASCPDAAAFGHRRERRSTS